MTTEANHLDEQPDEDVIKADEAASYLGVAEKELTQVLERYGIGRYYDANQEGHFVYARGDLDRAKASLEQPAAG
jgi:hypothetical protein